MTYSKKITATLKQKGLKEGQRIKIGVYEGLLMPSPEITGSPDYLIIKLDNGYNIGIKYTSKTKLEKSNTPEPEAIKQEYLYETMDQHVEKIEQAHSKPPIAILAVGGTIASKVDYKTGAVNAKLTARDLVRMVPELRRIATIKMDTLSEVMSEDMNHVHWQTLAKETAKQLNQGAEGVVITHGTDAMHFSSAALSFMLPKLPKPVVFTGSQRSPDRGSADSSMNLICSVHAAKNDVAEVGICMHAELDDNYCIYSRGTKVRKMHSTLRKAFRPINDYPLAKVWPSGRFQMTNRRVKFRSTEKAKTDTKFEPKVALIKAYPGSEPKLIDYLIKQGYKGIIIEGMALGHVPTQAKKSWIPHVKKAIQSGVPVIVTTQCYYGRVNPDVYTNLRILYYEAEAIPGADMLSETAYVKLGWVLGHVKSMKKVREMMLTNYAGELNARLEPRMFLY
ncbi:Glu-tRNA(Gln) amidotransferase subunit GatD [archaeon]|nr:Glu-tRNA(Gln) amidotransferase subunit GatD [archaeon]